MRNSLIKIGVTNMNHLKNEFLIRSFHFWTKIKKHKKKIFKPFLPSSFRFTPLLTLKEIKTLLPSSLQNVTTQQREPTFTFLAAKPPKKLKLSSSPFFFLLTFQQPTSSLIALSLLYRPKRSFLPSAFFVLPLLSVVGCRF